MEKDHSLWYNKGAKSLQNTREKRSFMNSLNTFAMESNKQFKINFAGGDLSSDAGLLLIKEFAAKIGYEDLVRKNFKTNDHAVSRHHTDADNLLQMIYQTIAAYHRDDDADE